MSYGNITITDFINIQTGLMNSYNQEALTHAGYIIALVIGIFTILSADSTARFYKGKLKNKLVTIFGFSVILSLIGYFSIKVIFWSWMGSEVLAVPLDAQIANSLNPLSTVQSITLMEFAKTDLLPLQSFTFDGIHGFSSTGIFIYISSFFGLFCVILAGLACVPWVCRKFWNWRNKEGTKPTQVTQNK